MSDTPDRPTGDADEPSRDEQSLEDVLGQVFGGQVDPAMADALRQMGLDHIDPAMVPLLQQQVRSMMNPVAPDSALDTSTTTQVACGIVAQAGDPEVTDRTRRDVEQVVQVANLWLDQVTDMPAPAGAAVAWTREEWVRETVPVWAQIAEPVAEGVAGAIHRAMSAQLGQALERGAQIPGLPPGMDPSVLTAQMGPMLKRMTSGMLGAQLGQAVGGLAGDVVSGTEIGLPLVRREAVAMLPGNVLALAHDLQLEPGEVHLFLAIREAARVRLFAEVGWLGPQLLEAVRAYARDIEIDTDAIEARVAEAGTQDPEELQRLLADGLFSPEPGPAQRAALARLETYLALVEGWVDVVAERAAAAHLPDVAKLAEAVRRRRATGGPAETAMAQLIGLELRPRRLRDAANLWAALEAEGGVTARDTAWAHPDIAPTATDLDDPLGYVQRRTGGQEPEAADWDAELDALLSDGSGDGEGDATPGADPERA